MGAYRALLICVALVMGAASGGWGQTATAGSGVSQPPGPTTANSRPQSTVPPESLAEAMAQAKPPDGQVAIAIASDSVRLTDSVTLTAKSARLPDGTAPPPPGSSVYLLADRFGMLARRFGGVIAIAPPAMTVLNTAPGAPHPFDGMPPSDAFKLLAGSLTPGQWRTLTSSQGLGVGDLQNDDQRELFKALFPDGGLHVAPMPALGYVPTHPEMPHFEVITQDDAMQSHIRLSREAEISLSMTGSRMFESLGRNPTPAGSHDYEVAVGPGFTPDLDTLYGVRLREKVPNTPKPGDLDFEWAALQAPVPLAGIKTVKDIIERIDRAARVELYADRRYEDRKVVIVAGARAARAADILQALAFCVCGAYRRVGPAFVLTDSLIGVGTRRAIIEEFDQAAGRARRGLIDQAGDAILQAHAAVDLPGRPGSITMTAEQIQQALKEQPASQIGNGVQITAPMEELSPAQQDAARQVMDAFVRQRETFSKLQNGPGRAAPGPLPTLDGPVLITMTPTVDLLIPSLDGPVKIGDILQPGGLFTPSDRLRQARAEAAAKPGPAAGARTPTPSLLNVLKSFPRRAVLVEAHTTADVDSIVASMRRLGLNELWLKVFDPEVPDVSTKAELDGGDLLIEALKVTRGTGVRVLPVVSLLKWRASTPAGERDLNILGEESPAAIARWRLDTRGGPRGSRSLASAASASPLGVAVTPFAASVRARLSKLMENLTREPGVAGIVWRSPTWSGYSDRDGGASADRCGELGYADPARIAFLRAKHADPVDIDPCADDLEMEAVSGIPGFDDFRLDQKLREEWGRFRVNEVMSLLQQLTAAATFPQSIPSRIDASPLTAGAARVPVLIEAGQPEYDAKTFLGWYGSWEGKAAPLPALRPFDSIRALAKEAHTGSKTAVVSLMPEENWTPVKTASTIDFWTKDAVWDGVVLDLTAAHTGPGRAPTSAERLAALAR
ncbi:MAG TPA: hypothetical protein VFJ58_09815 [Armatimonadota bacterium]|nr:hypothetical protein [Armatimonadota bacterium]